MTGPNRIRPVAVEGCLEVCRRCDRIAELAGRTRTSDGTTLYGVVGPHLRHCLDHFTCLTDGFDAGEVDYDSRARDASLEIDVTAFRAALAGVVERLEAISERDLGSAVRVRQMAAKDAPSVPLASTLARELAFLSSHTVHHLAIIVERAARQGVDLPEEVAVAFSTAAHRAATPGGR